MSARVYFMKTVNCCEDMSIMSPQDKQWIDGQVSGGGNFMCVCLYQKSVCK